VVAGLGELSRRYDPAGSRGGLTVAIRGCLSDAPSGRGASDRRERVFTQRPREDEGLAVSRTGLMGELRSSLVWVALARRPRPSAG
jgi:hypothetical protein